MPEQPDSLTLPTRARRPGQRLTKEERKKAQEAFLATFASSANVRAACMKATISRPTLYAWLEKDVTFSVRYHQAELDARDALLAAAWQRAVHGVEKPALSMGKQVYVDGRPLMIREYSDSVLLRLMGWKIPGFSEKQQVELTGRDGGPIDARTTLALDVSKLRDATPEELAALKALALKLKAKEGE